MPDALEPRELETVAQLIAAWSGQPIEASRSLAAKAFALGVSFHERIVAGRATERTGVEIPVLRGEGVPS